MENSSFDKNIAVRYENSVFNLHSISAPCAPVHHTSSIKTLLKRRMSQGGTSPYQGGSAL
jgi:hypothetical protein